jgi:ankyrin repeat protein
MVLSPEGTPEMLHYLELKGVPFIDKRGPNKSSVLNVAALYGKAENLAIFLQWGADVNAQDEWGSTPLHSAMRGQKIACIKLLVEAGCKTDLTDDKGRTAFDVLKEKPMTPELLAIKEYIATRFPKSV